MANTLVMDKVFASINNLCLVRYYAQNYNMQARDEEGLKEQVKFFVPHSACTNMQML